MGVPRRFRWVTILMRREALPHSRVCGNVARLPVSVVYDEYQKVKVRKWHLSYTPPLRLARAALSANVLSSISSTSAEILPNRDLLVDAYQKFTGEVFLLRSQVLGYFCVQAIRSQLYGMIGGRRRVIELYVVGALLAAGEIGRYAGAVTDSEDPRGFIGCELVIEDGPLGGKPCLGGCRVDELWSWTSSTPFF
ncbi:hypothetical protein HID58_042940, partial [Brassica napus]